MIRIFRIETVLILIEDYIRSYVGFPTTTPSTIAGIAILVNNRMTDFTCITNAAAKQFSLQHYAATQSNSPTQVDKIRHLLSNAIAVLTQSRTTGFIFDKYWHCLLYTSPSPR